MCNAGSLDYETLVILSGMEGTKRQHCVAISGCDSNADEVEWQPRQSRQGMKRDSFHPLLPFLIANNGFIQTAAHWASAEGRERGICPGVLACLKCPGKLEFGTPDGSNNIKGYVHLLNTWALRGGVACDAHLNLFIVLPSVRDPRPSPLFRSHCQGRFTALCASSQQNFNATRGRNEREQRGRFFP